METVRKLEKNWKAQSAFVLLGMALAYIFASLAIDSGSLLQWALAILFIGWAITSLIRTARLLIKH